LPQSRSPAPGGCCNAGTTGVWSRPSCHGSRCLPGGNSPAQAGYRDSYGPLTLAAQAGGRFLFCDNETNAQRLFGVPGRSPFPKDGINDRASHQTGWTGLVADLIIRTAGRNTAVIS
jgi:hypothetical protein